MIEYPKIETLYDRDSDTFCVDTTQVRWPEFASIKRWQTTEKIDGTNIRIGLHPDGTVTYAGRTDNAQLHVSLWSYLQATFPADKLRGAFETAGDAEVILFGEGYGPKIQKGGEDYRANVGFRLFDVLVGPWWLEQENIIDVASRLGVETVPLIGWLSILPESIADLGKCFPSNGNSIVARDDGGNPDKTAEGIVARASPMLFTRKGERLMWKLKFRDFVGGNQK